MLTYVLLLLLSRIVFYSPIQLYMYSCKCVPINLLAYLLIGYSTHLFDDLDNFYLL